MSQLPGIANAILDDLKITHYLLSTAHPTGASKAKFFVSFGFSQENWAELKSALLKHPQNNPVTSQASSPFGQKFEVSCSLVAPDGRKPLHHLGMDNRATRPQSEVHHRVSTPLSEQADAARRVAGGWRVSGRYPFSSGCDWAQWAIIGAFLGEKGDPRGVAYLLVPLAEIEIVDDWQVLGSSAPAASLWSCTTCSFPRIVR